MEHQPNRPPPITGHHKEGTIMELIIGSASIASGLYLAYCAGKDAQYRAKATHVTRQYEAAMGEAKQRHPAYREPASQLDRWDGVR